MTHRFHGAPPARPWVPRLASSTLAAAIGAFLLGGLVAALAAPDEPAAPSPHSWRDTPDGQARIEQVFGLGWSS
ncbi:hypothetical protein LRP67_16025 [Nocardioides sp. cx-169]|uniref:hypothetical protein n=1 Tax=Nocardioides sp. cx-169 TaxID=2899080 RepID=UPI001E2F01A5|nr:hypothetical protein [Nocardioides sp. cx-169]MCD4535600.1 hypothetical protein [Nocardioides sp. cx-169]